MIEIGMPLLLLILIIWIFAAASKRRHNRTLSYLNPDRFEAEQEKNASVVKTQSRSLL